MLFYHPHIEVHCSFVADEYNHSISHSFLANEEGGAVMSHRLVPSIYQVFMVAVDKVHIPPGLWRTFRDYAATWRHRPAVVYGRKTFLFLFDVIIA